MNETPQVLEEKDAAPVKIHLSYLDGVRACAALYILCHHGMRFATANGYGIDYHPQASNLLENILFWFFNCFGQMAVAVFICLSGFCLMIPVVRGRSEAVLAGNSPRFFAKRARRILPPYYASIALSLLLIVTLIGNRTGNIWDLCLPSPPHRIVSSAALITHLLLVQDLFPFVNGQIDGPLWSVAAEWRIYFIFPLFVWAWRRFGAIRVSIVTLVGSVLTHWFLPHLLHRFPLPLVVGPTQFVPEYFGLFGLGALGAGIAFSNQPSLVALRMRLPYAWLVILPVIATALTEVPVARAFLSRLPMIGELQPILQNLLIGVSSVALMTMLGLGRWSWMRHWFSRKFLVFVGMLSYSLYLIHYPIEAALYKYVIGPSVLTRPVQGLAMILLSLPVCIGASFLFYRLVEKPSHQWSGKTGPKPSQH